MRAQTRAGLGAGLGAALAATLLVTSFAVASATAIATVQTGTSPSRGNAVDTAGHLWVPYAIPEYPKHGIGIKDEQIFVARQVDAHGRGCLLPTWSCSRVDKPANASQVSVASSPDGSVWLAYYAKTKAGRSQLKVAHFVNAGGTGCTSPQWSCEIVAEDPGFFQGETAPSIAVLADGTPVVAFEAGTSSKPQTSMSIARRTPGAGCADAGWTCAVADHTTTGYTGFPAIATQTSGEIDLAYFGTDGSIWIANTQLGAPARHGCAAGFHCERLLAAFDPNAFFPSITLTVGPQSRLWVGFPLYDPGTSSTAVGVASQDGSGHWTIERADAWSAAFALNYATIAFDSLGHAVVAYQDASFQTLRVARRVGADTCGAVLSPGWQCTTIDSDPGGLVGYFPTIATTGSTLSITYGDVGTTSENMRVATL